MLTPAVNQHRDGPVIEVIHTAADERKPCACEIGHRWRKIELRAQPRFDRVALRRSHIGYVTGQCCTRVAADYFFCDELFGRRVVELRGDDPRHHRGYSNERRWPQPVPPCTA